MYMCVCADKCIIILSSYVYIHKYIPSVDAWPRVNNIYIIYILTYIDDFFLDPPISSDADRLYYIREVTLLAGKE